MHDIFFIGHPGEQWSTAKTKYSNIQRLDTGITIAELQRLSFTSMFWVIWDDVELTDFNINSYKETQWDNQYTHIFKNGNFFDGICLINKKSNISNKEFNHRFFINKKEIDILASNPVQYDMFEIDTYADYLAALEKSKTDLFWIVPHEVEIIPMFNFDLYFSHHNSYDRNMNHVFHNIFRNAPEYTGVALMSKNKKVTSKEINYRFLIEKKQHEIIASKMKPYDIVFISYSEPNADENYNKLLSRFPRAKRIHGVKGIHQAHIKAAEMCDTGMFWVVDGDADIVDSFNFDYEVSRYELNIVHVWRAKNPVNGLEYGNGGVKLLPRQLTIDMDLSKPDMTTNISKWFKAMEEVSNITTFNTDSFATWRSAFRECCKLASRVIERQEDTETQERLDAWCKKSNDHYAIDGACAGRDYGLKNKDNVEALKMINDFTWLEEQFNERCRKD